MRFRLSSDEVALIIPMVPYKGALRPRVTRLTAVQCVRALNSWSDRSERLTEKGHSAVKASIERLSALPADAYVEVYRD